VGTGSLCPHTLLETRRGNGIECYRGRDGAKQEPEERAMDARPATALFRLPSLAPRSAAPPRVLLWWGITLICIGVLGFCSILYATLLSKLLPPSGVPILDAIRSDW